MMMRDQHLTEMSQEKPALAQNESWSLNCLKEGWHPGKGSDWQEREPS